MADDQDNGFVEKAKDAKDSLADKVEPTDDELRRHGYHGAGGSDGDSEAVVQAPTST